MNALQTAAVVVGLITGVGGISWAGLSEFQAIRAEADAKYVPLSEWQDFQWSQIKRDIRQIEKEIADAEYNERFDLADKLEEDLDNLIDFLCRRYPEDREC